MARKLKTLYVTDREMDKIHKHFYTKYPWLYKGNTLYSASVVGMWELKMQEEDAREIVHLLKPCELGNFELLTD